MVSETPVNSVLDIGLNRISRKTHCKVGKSTAAEGVNIISLGVP